VTPARAASPVPDRPFSPARFTVVGDWQVRVEAGPIRLADRWLELPEPVVLSVPPTSVVAVADEEYRALPVYQPAAAGWRRGAALRGVACQECSARYQLEPDSVRLKHGAGQAAEWRRGIDWEIDPEWGTFGRLEGGAMGPSSAVRADYRHGLSRLDAIVVEADGRVALRVGTPHIANPRPAVVPAGAATMARLYTTQRQSRLTPASVFPILEDAYPEPPVESPSFAERTLPRTLAALRGGRPLRLLAWGDSVTHAGYLADPAQRWQAQLVKALQERFLRADITLLTLGWGGRTTGSFLAEPPGSAYNYRERVLGSRPDLVISEFVNDAALDAPQTLERYGRILEDFRAIGAEWVILTPHYTRPDWMGLTSERDCDDDPRPYVQALREFAAAHPVGLADASRRYGRLWRQGIPYNTLMLNGINHPDEVGMRIFVDAIMALFPSG